MAVGSDEGEMNGALEGVARADSFIYPLVRELLELAIGMSAYDALSRRLFALHAYVITGFGDIPAVSMLMHMKGHNGLCPCRMCSILAIRIPDS
jgi:hypothetical protein